MLNLRKDIALHSGKYSSVFYLFTNKIRCWFSDEDDHV